MSERHRAVDPMFDLTLVDVLAEHRRSRPQRLALVCGEDRLSYLELDERSSRLARALASTGVGPSSRVLWLGQNCHRMVECLSACAKLGAVLVAANWRQSAAEMVGLLEDAEPVVVLWQRTEIGSRVLEARSAWRGSARWVCHDDPDDPDPYEPFVALGDPSPPLATPWSGDPVLQLYTGAFGGTPNGATVSHRAIVGQSLVMAWLQQLSESTVYLSSGPMFHVATLMTTFAVLLVGGTNVIVRRVEAEELCRVIDAERCTYGFVMGPTAEEMLAVNADGRYDLSGFRTFGGSPQWNAMVQVDTSPWGTHPAGYGQTELAGLATFNALGVGTAGTSGRPSPLAQVRIVDPEDREVATGETGEIVVRGPLVTCGYHNRPALDAQRFRGGWWHTGDLGRREADGSITFVAPLTRIVKSGAENIYPAEVEACLLQHPSVRHAAIIGVPDARWGQQVVAVVELHDGATTSEAALIDHCRATIASYKKPSRVIFVDALPRQGWAVDYDELDRRYGGGGYPGIGSVAAPRPDRSS